MHPIEQAMRVVGAMSRTEIRAAINDTREFIKQMPDALSADSAPVQHFFAPGCYAREITMAEGTVVIGKIHKHAHINILSKGRVLVLTEHGSEEFEAPRTFVSEPYIQRVVHVLDDAVWTTVHITNSTDLTEIEREVIATDYSEVEINAEFTEVQP